MSQHNEGTQDIANTMKTASIPMSVRIRNDCLFSPLQSLAITAKGKKKAVQVRRKGVEIPFLANDLIIF